MQLVINIGQFSDENSREQLLNELISEYAMDLKRIAYIYVKDKAQCEDIVQEVFISAYKNLVNFREDSNYKTWLIRITLNKCKDYHRKWSIRNIAYKPLLDPFVNKKGNVKSAEEELETSERAEHIIQAISCLGLKYKVVLILYYYQNMTLQEISDTTNIKFNTVKTRFVRGKSLLKTELERRGIYYG